MDGDDVNDGDDYDVYDDDCGDDDDCDFSYTCHNFHVSECVEFEESAPFCGRLSLIHI